MLQQFLRTATDGWDLALASVRNLFAEADLHAEEVGGDFAGEAARLGRRWPRRTRRWPSTSPSATRSAEEMSALADAMRDAPRRAAIDVVPALAEHAEALRATYDALAALADVPVQQVHGDLHLGQTLRTVKGWKIVDFEGEPAKPLAERLLPDSPWRDVAGMLRSFDYAPRVVRMTSFAARPRRWHEDGSRPIAPPSGRSATHGPSWRRTPNASSPPTEQTLLDAYVADKAVYEAVYEARNRPTWVEIPLDALAGSSAWHSQRDPRTESPVTTHRTRHRTSDRHRPGAPGELDIHLIHEGRHEELWKVLGAQVDSTAACPSGCGRPTRSRSRSPASGRPGTARSTR